MHEVKIADIYPGNVKHRKTYSSDVFARSVKPLSGHIVIVLSDGVQPRFRAGRLERRGQNLNFMSGNAS